MIEFGAMIIGINLIFCVVILLLSFIIYARKNSASVLFVGLAFGLFGISHLMSLLGLTQELEFILIAVRTLAYLLVIGAMVLWLK